MAVAEAAVGEAEEARMTMAWRTRTSQTWPPGTAAAGISCGGRSRSNRLRRTSSGEGKRQWVMNDYKFEDARNPATGAEDGNKDDGENNSNNNNNRWTSSAQSNFIVRILFLTLLLLAYSKLSNSRIPLYYYYLQSQLHL